MFLCMDEKGNYYQAAQHRSDGKGVEKMAQTVQGFGEGYFDKSVKDMGSQIEREGKILTDYNMKQDKYEEIRKKKEEAHRKLHAAEQKKIREIEYRLQSKMVENAVMKSMQGADFDQLSIVDSNYGKVHEAYVQTSRNIRQTDQKYIGNAMYANQLEVEQAQMLTKANQMSIQDRIRKQQEESAVSRPLLNSTRDQLMQNLLEGEIMFSTEEEAKAFDKMNQADRLRWLKRQQAMEAEEAASKSNVLPFALAAGVALLLMGGV